MGPRHAQRANRAGELACIFQPHEILTLLGTLIGLPYDFILLLFHGQTRFIPLAPTSLDQDSRLNTCYDSCTCYSRPKLDCHMMTLSLSCVYLIEKAYRTGRSS